MTWRDPCVFFDDADRKYHMLFCSKRPERETPDCFAGGTGHAVSDDLVRWTCLPQLPIYGVACSTECPDVFKDRNRYVMIYYWHETRVRSADALEGPWERGDVISPDHFDFMAAKRMTDGDGRHVLVGWLPRRDCDCKERTWGGNMLIPRELRMKGKTPVTRFVPELDKAFIREVPGLSPEQLIFCGDGWEKKNDSFSAASPAGGTLAYFRDLPAVCRIRTNVTVQDKNGLILFLIGVRPCYHTEKECLDEGYALLLDPSENLVRLRRHYEWDQRNDIAVIPFEFPIGKPFFLDIVLDGGIIEVGVDREQTLVSRMLDFHTGHLAISVQDTKASFEDFSCTTLP